MPDVSSADASRQTLIQRTALTISFALAACVLVGVETASAVDVCRVTESDLDLNGDGYDDTVVGDPYATVNGRAGAGAVVILYGDADRRIGEGKRALLTQATAGIPGIPEAGDHFGWSVAVDDISGDGCADIVVGSPGEDVGSVADAGVVHIVSFVPDGNGGLGKAGGEVLEDDFGAAVSAEDHFGYAVAAANRRGSGQAVVAIGAPGRDVGGAADAGVVYSISYDGEGSSRHRWQQGTVLPGVPEPGDRFGGSVLVGPVTVTDGADTAVSPVTVLAGAPGDTVQLEGSPTLVDNSGSVTVWDDVSGYEQLITQETTGVPGVAEVGDQFGHSLALAFRELLDNQPQALVVGAPGEDVGPLADAGAVTLVSEDEGVAGLKGRLALTQNTAGFDGAAEPGDRFGHSVGLRPEDLSTAGLVIGVPYEDVGAVTNAGMVQTATLFPFSAEVQPVRSYTENSAGTPGTVAAGNRFGLAVAGSRGVGESIFAIASPYQKAGSVFVVDRENVTRSWVPGTRGIPVPAGSGRFGWALTGLESLS